MRPTAERLPETLSIEDLLALLSARHEVLTQQDLPALIELARKVERVHADVPEAPLGLADALEKFALELDMHMQAEEEVLFPAMLRRTGNATAHPIALRRAEHADCAAELDGIAALAHGFTVPEHACGSWRRLYAGVEALCAGLRELMRVENDVLFPRFAVAGHTRCICAQ